MFEKIKYFLPLEFQGVERIKKRTINNRKSSKVAFYQSDKATGENFYKPISKIVKIE